MLALLQVLHFDVGASEKVKVVREALFQLLGTIESVNYDRFAALFGRHDDVKAFQAGRILYVRIVRVRFERHARVGPVGELQI